MQRKDMFVTSGDEMLSSITLCNRLFSKKYFQYTGIIHEQVSRIDGREYDMEVLPIFVDHVGYVQGKEDKDAKADRNIRLLKKELDEKGEDPYILYQLGKGYYYKGDYSKSVSYFRKALEYDLDTNLEYVGNLVETYGYSLLNRKLYRIALQLENLYTYFEKRCDFVFLMGLIYMNNAMFDKAVDEFKKATKYKTSSVEGTNSYLAYYNIGVIYEVQGDVKQAIKYYRKSEHYEKSKIRLKSLNHL